MNDLVPPLNRRAGCTVLSQTLTHMRYDFVAHLMPHTVRQNTSNFSRAQVLGCGDGQQVHI